MESELQPPWRCALKDLTDSIPRIFEVSKFGWPSPTPPPPPLLNLESYVATFSQLLQSLKFVKKSSMIFFGLYQTPSSAFVLSKNHGQYEQKNLQQKHGSGLSCLPQVYKMKLNMFQTETVGKETKRYKVHLHPPSHLLLCQSSHLSISGWNSGFCSKSWFDLEYIINH